MIYSPEFWSREAYRAKVKTPFELVASTARALDADVSGFASAGAVGWTHGRAAVPVRAAHRLFRQVGHLGEYRRAPEPPELRPGIRWRPHGRRQRGFAARCSATMRRRARPKWRFLARSMFFSTARSPTRNARDARGAAERSANFAGQTTAADDPVKAGECRTDFRPGARRAGISAPLDPNLISLCSAWECCRCT